MYQADMFTDMNSTYNAQGFIFKPKCQHLSKQSDIKLMGYKDHILYFGSEMQRWFKVSH